MAAAIPEIAMVIRNQLAMIYDLGVAYDRQSMLQHELLVGIFVSAAGMSGTALLAIHGGKVVVRRTSLRVLQRIIAMLAGKVTQQLLKSMIVKWLPIFGAAAISAWSNYTTHQIGQYAMRIYGHKIEVVSDTVDVLEPEPPGGIRPQDGDSSLKLLRLQTLINLMQFDGRLKIEEVRYLGICIEEARLEKHEKLALVHAIETAVRFPIDHTVFKHNLEEAGGLLMDMIALAKRDGMVHQHESEYIKRVAGVIGLPNGDIDRILAR